MNKNNPTVETYLGILRSGKEKKNGKTIVLFATLRIKNNITY